MGFVTIRVYGKTFPHRRNLIDDYGLEYDFRKKDFKGAFNGNSKRIGKLKLFCEKKRLCMEMDGEEIVNPKNVKKEKKTLSKEDIEDIDEFNLSQWLPILQQSANEKDIGKMGETFLPLVSKDIGFNQEDIDSDSK